MKISGKFQFQPQHHHHHQHYQPLSLDSSAVKFPGYSLAHHDLGLLQPVLTPDDLDAVVTEAKHQDRQSKQLAVKFPRKNIQCAGYSMLGCV